MHKHTARILLLKLLLRALGVDVNKALACCELANCYTAKHN